jgi:hypothetical protein
VTLAYYEQHAEEFRAGTRGQLARDRLAARRDLLRQLDTNPSHPIALRACMDSLNIDLNAERIHRIDAKIFNERTRVGSGPIEVMFNSNWHSGDGPFLEFEEDLEGYGIHYREFKPHWLEMVWNEAARELRVNHKDYAFTLTFARQEPRPSAI